MLLIKSKSLIPELELSEEEEGSIGDLERRLAAYEKAREAARELSKIFGRSVMLEAGEKEAEPIFAPSKDMTLATLADALAHALATLEKVEERPEARVKSHRAGLTSGRFASRPSPVALNPAISNHRFPR